MNKLNECILEELLVLSTDASNEEGLSQLQIDILFFVSDYIGANFQLLINIGGDKINHKFRFCALALRAKIN